MSSVLKFPLEKVQRRSIGNIDETHNAEILVFEGVRYEKMKTDKKLSKRKKTVSKK